MEEIVCPVCGAVAELSQGQLSLSAPEKMKCRNLDDKGRVWDCGAILDAAAAVLEKQD